MNNQHKAIKDLWELIELQHGMYAIHETKDESVSTFSVYYMHHKSVIWLGAFPSMNTAIDFINNQN